MENIGQQLSDTEPLTDYEKNIVGHSIEKDPAMTRKYRRPDGTTVEVLFYKNQFGGYFVSTKDSLGEGQRLQGNLESNPEDVEEYLRIWSEGLRYREIKN